MTSTTSHRFHSKVYFCQISLLLFITLTLALITGFQTAGAAGDLRAFGPLFGGGGSGSGGGGGMGMGGPPYPMLNYAGVQTVSVQRSTKTSLSSVDASRTKQNRWFLSTPIAKVDNDLFTMSLAYSTLYFQQPVVLSAESNAPSSASVSLPQYFERIEIGSGYTHPIDDARQLSVRLSVGSASDKPFYSMRESTFSLASSYSFPNDSENSYWMLSLFISNNNTIANYMPLPGVAYLYKQPNFMGMFGFPLTSVLWTPVDPWAWSFSLFGTAINSEMTYGDRKALQGFVGFNWSQQSFIQRERIKDRYRVFLDEKRGYFGLRMPLIKHLATELQGGYLFDRVVSQGTRFYKRQNGRSDLQNAWYVTVNLRLTP